jgi:hypothetical protein
MKITVGTAHLTVVNISEKGVERRSNQGKSWKMTLAYTPGALKFFFSNRFSTKFNRKVAFGTSRIRKVEVAKKRVRPGSNWQKN